MAKRILLIDDELELAFVTKTRLESAGYEVCTAATAEEALVYLQKNMPDLILLDLLLPKMQGEEFCTFLKSDNRLKHLPVILFTASAIDIPKVAGEIYADGYLMKPCEPDVLLSTIKKTLER
ncbi:MAG TPA: response regulator [Candidatus Wunengus californicus]|uniref:response regulator n=1 Tax=Candidatus Wunengus californicus TaxID=3367619 RepID=UPI002AE23A55|nr:response regulator [Deltaproteobacteria bacterium]MBI2341202.1 response regulator [Deltaproteobacteria bacterium]